MSKMIFNPYVGLIPIDVYHKPLLILKDMIEWTLSYQNHPNVQQTKQAISPKAWLKEYCTIRYGLPRQAGHTTSAIYLADIFLTNPLFVVDSQRMGKYWQEIMEHLELSKWKKNVFTTGQFKNGSVRGISYDGIVVDCSFLWSQKDQDYLYNMAAEHFAALDKGIIIFLQ